MYVRSLFCSLSLLLYSYYHFTTLSFWFGSVLPSIIRLSFIHSFIYSVAVCIVYVFERLSDLNLCIYDLVYQLFFALFLKKITSKFKNNFQFRLAKASHLLLFFFSCNRHFFFAVIIVVVVVDVVVIVIVKLVLNFLLIESNKFTFFTTSKHLNALPATHHTLCVFRSNFHFNKKKKKKEWTVFGWCCCRLCSLRHWNYLKHGSWGIASAGLKR